MTQIDFFHGAADKLVAASQLAGELYREGRRVFIFAPDSSIATAVDRLLWTHPPIGFVPHCAAGSALAAQTPIVIGQSLDDTSHEDVLINLDGDLPAGFGRFHRLIEIVSNDDADRLPARSRYKHYRDRGYPLAAQDFATRTAPSRQA
ncbi:MAG: DNA polymerase III subunit chi [Rhodocyclaceae bacterium]